MVKRSSYWLVASLLVLGLSWPGTGLAQDEWEFELLPYAAVNSSAKRATLAIAAGDYGKAVRWVAKAKELPGSVRDFWTARLLLAAGKKRKALKQFAQVARGDSVLAPVAAMQLGELALARKDWQEAIAFLPLAARHPGWCGPAQLGLWQAHRGLGNGDAAGEAFALAMACTPDLVARRRAVLARPGDSTQAAGECRLRLLHQAYFGRSKEAGIAAALRAHWGEEFRDLELLRLLMRGRRSSWRKAMAGLQPGETYAKELLAGIIAKQQRRQKKADALPHFERARQMASTPLRESIAQYYTGRTLESLDRDLEAKDLYQDLVKRHPDFPLARSLTTRIGEIALREGQPLQAMGAAEAFLATSCPGEAQAQALHLAAFVSYLAGDWQSAKNHWDRLARTHFFSSQSPWVKWGPLALFWRAKATLAAGEQDLAGRQLELIARLFPGDYYGVVAAYRMGQLGLEAAPPAAGRLDVSPLTVPKQAELPSTYGPVVELYRLGYWEEAHEAARTLIGLGELGPESGDLLLTSYLRCHSLRSAISYRRSLGMMPAPWRQGARMWRTSLPFDYGEAVTHGFQSSGLAKALIAAIIRFESNYSPSSTSHAGAIGLLQVKHNTGNAVAGPCLGQKPVSERELRDPMVNLELGSLYIRELVHRHHDNWAVALAAYNAGPGTASWWLGRFAGLNSDAFIEQITYPNTVGYVKRILGAAPMYWSLLYPLLGETPVAVELPLTIPGDVRPFLDESGGRCGPKTTHGEAP
jgi:soluble lytic murein transglycosylase-like protein